MVEPLVIGHNATSFHLATREPRQVHFADRLSAAVKQRGNPVLVGLDPRWQSLPAQLRTGDENSPDEVAAAYEQFCRGIIDVVAPLVAAVKPQAAFFEQCGPAGMAALAQVVAHARQQGLLVILDGKRNDIGSTGAAYAAAYVGHESAWGADALTVSPYLGDDSLTPFVDAAREAGGGIFVLVKTSNPGGKTFQDLELSDGEHLYQRVARHVQQLAESDRGECGYGSVGAVVGATYPEQLEQLRGQMPNAWLLVPGFGAQGAGPADVAGAFDRHGLGAVVNSSRGIIFAHQRPEFERFGDARWQDAVEAATREMAAQLNEVSTPRS